MITSTGNERIRHAAALSAKAKLRREERLFVAEGERFFMDTPEASVREIFYTEEFLARAEERVRKKLSACADRAEAVTRQVMEKAASTVTPQGILCVLSQPAYEMEELLAKNAPAGGGREGGAPPLLLLLENIQDPGNLGTLFRTAEAAGVSGIVLSRGCTDLFGPKAVRSTMSAIFRVPFLYAEDFPAAAVQLQGRGVELYAAHLNGSADYDAEDYTAPCGFMIGNEGSGLTREAAELAGKKIRIPMEGGIESLNAAMAGGILLYEAYRQRRKAVCL